MANTALNPAISQAFNLTRISLKLNGMSVAAVAFTGKESLSNGFRFTVTSLFDADTHVGSFIGSSAQLRFRGQDGITRDVAGVVAAANTQGNESSGQLRVDITLTSHLHKLSLQRDTRIILGHTIPDIIRFTCEQHNLMQLKFDLSQAYPVQPYILQADETDWAFIQRLMAQSGLYSYSTCNDEQEVIVFTDNNANCPYIARAVLEHVAPSGQPKMVDGKYVVGVQQLMHQVSSHNTVVNLHDYNEQTPTTRLHAGSGQAVHSAAGKTTPHTVFGRGTRTLDDTAASAKRASEGLRTTSEHADIHSNVVDMAAGHVCSLATGSFDETLSGDYLLVSVSHSAAQPSGVKAHGDDLAYHSSAYAIKRDVPYRSRLPAHPDLPMTFTARIESDGPYARLDEQGRYQLRGLFDLSTTEHTQATTPLRRLQPYGGPIGNGPNESTVGMHTPLQDGDEVLLSCLNGDPNRPMVVGSAPNPERKSPVTGQNKTQNRLRSQSDNELHMDDTRDDEVIHLRTYAGYNILQFNARAAEHKLRMATEHGAMERYAKKTILTQSDDTMTELVGNDRAVIVENKHITKTTNKEIHHQTPTDNTQSAHDNIQTKSGKNTELKTGKHLKIDVNDNQNVTIKGSQGMFVTVKNSEVFIQSANKIDIKGQGGGDITFEQSGGGFKVDAGGNVNLYGKKVTIGGNSGVTMNGNISYSVPGPVYPPGKSVTSPLRVKDILNLVADNPEPSIQDIEINLIDEFDNELPEHLKMLDDIKYRLTTDGGEVREGVIKDGKIKEKQVQITSDYTLEFSEQLPIDMELS